jgi:hypothetical protein
MSCGLDWDLVYLVWITAGLAFLTGHYLSRPRTK